MDAGISLREHVAGVSVGLVSDVDPSTGMIQDYRILTDILVIPATHCSLLLEFHICVCFILGTLKIRGSRMIKL